MTDSISDVGRYSPGSGAKGTAIKDEGSHFCDHSERGNLIVQSSLQLTGSFSFHGP